jgi:hypothetical protein
MPCCCPSRTDPGGPLIVMTTAGYVMGPDLDMARVIDFRLSVDRDIHGEFRVSRRAAPDAGRPEQGRKHDGPDFVHPLSCAAHEWPVEWARSAH